MLPRPSPVKPWKSPGKQTLQWLRDLFQASSFLVKTGFLIPTWIFLCCNLCPHPALSTPRCAPAPQHHPGGLCWTCSSILRAQNWRKYSRQVLKCWKEWNDGFPQPAGCSLANTPSILCTAQTFMTGKVLCWLNLLHTRASKILFLFLYMQNNSARKQNAISRFSMTAQYYGLKSDHQG